MVPVPVDDDGVDLNTKALQYRLLHASNVFQPQEALGGHPIIEFVLSHNELCELAKHKSPSRTQLSYLTETFDPDAEDDDES